MAAHESPPDEAIPVYTLFGTAWRLVLGALVVGALSASLGFLAVQKLILTPEVEAPNLVSRPLVDAVEHASGLGFPLLVEKHEVTELLEEGRVLAQRPAPGVWVKEGATLRVTLAARP